MYAFGITEDDISNVMLSLGVNISDKRANDLLELLNIGEIERAALCADDLDEQTNCAYAEIMDQLLALDLPELSQVKKEGK